MRGLKLPSKTNTQDNGVESNTGNFIPGCRPLYICTQVNFFNIDIGKSILAESHIETSLQCAPPSYCYSSLMRPHRVH